MTTPMRAFALLCTTSAVEARASPNRSGDRRAADRVGHSVIAPLELPAAIDAIMRAPAFTFLLTMVTSIPSKPLHSERSLRSSALLQRANPLALSKT